LYLGLHFLDFRPFKGFLVKSKYYYILDFFKEFLFISKYYILGVFKDFYSIQSPIIIEYQLESEYFDM